MQRQVRPHHGKTRVRRYDLQDGYMGEGLSRGSHPIRLGLRLFPGAHTTVGEVVITMSDGTLNVIFAFLNGS